MKLENLNCQYIKISSDSFEQGYTSEKLTELQITAHYNDSANITKNISLTSISDTQSVQFVCAEDMYIKQIYIRNLITGQLYPSLENTEVLEITQHNLDTIIMPELQAKLFTLTNTIYSVSASFSEGVIVMASSGLSYPLVIDKVVVGLFGVDKEYYFANENTSGIMIRNGDIILSSEFFGQQSLQNGVYNVTSIITTTTQEYIQEQTCLFVDCTMAGLLHQLVDPSECDQEKMHLLLLHYSLVQSSNNVCDCNKMYKIYKYLADSISNQSIEDCGCQ